MTSLNEYEIQLCLQARDRFRRKPIGLHPGVRRNSEEFQQAIDRYTRAALKNHRDHATKPKVMGQRVPQFDCDGKAVADGFELTPDGSQRRTYNAMTEAQRTESRMRQKAAQRLDIPAVRAHRGVSLQSKPGDADFEAAVDQLVKEELAWQKRHPEAGLV